MSRINKLINLTTVNVRCDADKIDQIKSLPRTCNVMKET